MTRQIVLRSPAVNRRLPLLANERAIAPREKRKVGEVAGGTAAECAAICCCCPCGLMNLVILAVYKVPAGLWKKSKMRRQRKKEDTLLKQRPPGPTCCCNETDVVAREGGSSDKDDETTAAAEMEKEMWDRFYGTGFWRSPSQRGT